MRHRRSNRSRSGEAGYLLLAAMLAMTVILIALSIEAPRIAQQIKREKEEELVHRGRDYAYAVKRFAHKNGGRYPVSIEQLEDTNHVRFLRKRYKDPMTGDSDWKLIHYGEAQVTIPTANSTNPGLNPSTNNPGLGGGTSSTSNNNNTGGGSTFGGSSSGGLGSGGSSLGSGSGTFNSGSSTPPVLGANSQTNATPTQNGSNGQLGSLATSGIGNGQTTGGGQIIGVASVSKGKSIKEFNDKDHYNDWLFVYDLRLEQSGGTGVTVAAPMAANSTGAVGAAPGNANNAAGTNGTQNPNGQPIAPSNGGTPPQQAPAPTPN